MAEKAQRALITGASSGIGYWLAKRLAARGYEIWVVARRLELLQSLVAEIAASGGKAHVLALDVSQHDSVQERLAKLDVETGGMDLVIANAGLGGERATRPVVETGWAS